MIDDDDDDDDLLLRLWEVLGFVVYYFMILMLVWTVRINRTIKRPIPFFASTNTEDSYAVVIKLSFLSVSNWVYKYYLYRILQPPGFWFFSTPRIHKLSKSGQGGRYTTGLSKLIMYLNRAFIFCIKYKSSQRHLQRTYKNKWPNFCR
jgi:hypothetical protein